jgi:sugar phosphate isomerase/epimerase
LTTIAADPFFGAIEVSWIKNPLIRKQAAEVLATAGIEVIFAAQPALLQQQLSLCTLDLPARQQAVEETKRLIDHAYELGAAMLVVLSGPDPGAADRRAATEALVDSLKQLCSYAQEKSEDRMLSISLENFDRELDKKQLIGPTKEAAAVAEAVWAEYSNFGLTIDLSHLPQLRERADETVLAAVDHLIHVHIGNCVISDETHPAYGDKHPRFGIAGGVVGVEEVKRFFEALIYAGYFKRNTPTTKPVVSFEVRPLAEENPLLVLANAKRTLLQAWAQL